MKWIYRILMVILIICVVGMAVTAISKAKKATAQTDAYIRYLDAKYGWEEDR